ncbi:MAG: hypothetical protein HY261_03230 [Chloroflexi bacterium]|nr:hypothetical protein [Chloroflexota bacterium]
MLTAIAKPSGAIVRSDDRWMPQGFDSVDEAKLGENSALLEPDHRRELTSWWSKISARANTPNWDIASTCSIEDKPGLLLVEAKAHVEELSLASKTEPKTKNGWINHEQIKKAIAAANSGLNDFCPGWSLSVNSHYQLCNRFAWNWKLATMQIPVVLVYLGFLNCQEMSDEGELFATPNAWERSLHAHADSIVPGQVWGSRIDVQGTALWAIISSLPAP